ncbi:asparagine synthase (glutamine-hydrolyzing) [Thalassobacillus sp. CUG 92003]|uniref:asparagine synthase (glutamine-hydrolyzing) n=1 Tax=Thalassobacillus sp. CUG 92003 TaxID=2736641 RepID=UPI0015E6B14B|nr:asparagine synthase (glutamine-hydrolyzing) [Thalassobacillus sp. CUG 92003]
MCGIVGWIGSTYAQDDKAAMLYKMAMTLEHRGPDEYNNWTDGEASFGHQRLIVVDPAGGRQPMSRQKGNDTYTICYNGELYNTEDIRRLLQARGWDFRSHSDTEVLLVSYMEWGEACVDRLNGIFAFAIWDSTRKTLFLARDRLGVKPLFYYEGKNMLVFASEMKAILAHPDIPAELDAEGLHEVLALGPSRTPGHGVFSGMKEIRGGHRAIYQEGKLHVERYWNVKSQPHEDTLEATIAHVRYLFNDAVQRQLVSDVPLGTFLSGGVDSSAITAIAAKDYAKKGKGRLHTFSIDYKDQDRYFKKNQFQPDRDEKFIDMITQEHNTNHANLVASPDVLVEQLKRAVELRDLPGMADVDSSLLWFCKEIKKYVTVALSGECADEIFGGYPWFYKQEELKRKGFPWIRSLHVRSDLLHPDLAGELDLEAYMLRRYQETIDEMPVLPGENKEEAKRREMFYLNMNWFMQTLLDRKDRMSMGASLEVRVPFSDHRLVEYVWNIPWEMKRYGNQEKGLLRKALEGILPDDVLYRKKNPYPKTFHPEYTKGVVNWMDTILADSQSPLLQLFNRDKLIALSKSEGKSIDTPWFGQLMTGPQLIAHLCQINYWMTTNNITLK